MRYFIGLLWCGLEGMGLSGAVAGSSIGGFCFCWYF